MGYKMKVLNTFKKIVTTRYQTEIIEVSPEVLLIVEKANYKITSETFAFKKDCKINKTKQSYQIINKAKDTSDRAIWQYFSPAILDEIQTKHMAKIDTRTFRLSPYKEFIDKGNLSLENVLWFDYSSHLVYRLGQEAPVSGVFHFDYIGGVNNKDFHIEKVFEHLRKNPEVLEVEMEEIPYYNRDINYTKGLSMKVCISQAKMNEVWNCVKGFPSPSCDLKRAFIPVYWDKIKVDPLGIKEFARTKDELEVIEKEQDRDRYDSYDD